MLKTYQYTPRSQAAIYALYLTVDSCYRLKVSPVTAHCAVLAVSPSTAFPAYSFSHFFLQFLILMQKAVRLS